MGFAEQIANSLNKHAPEAVAQLGGINSAPVQVCCLGLAEKFSHGGNTLKYTEVDTYKGPNSVPDLGSGGIRTV